MWLELSADQSLVLERVHRTLTPPKPNQDVEKRGGQVFGLCRFEWVPKGSNTNLNEEKCGVREAKLVTLLCLRLNLRVSGSGVFVSEE